MRFTKDTSLIQVLKYSSQRLARIISVPVTNGYRKLRQVLNPNGFTTRVMADVRKGSKELIQGKPQSLKDYFSVGNYYIAKKLVFLVGLLVLVVPVIYLKFLHPVIRSNFLTTTMVVNSLEMTGYNGKVELLSSRGGTVLYRGPLVDGRITGDGKLYDYEGNLVYQGGFLLEQYEGSGQTFWPNGNPCYIGTFASNQYEGRGKLYAENGTLIYEGDFVAGKYEGSGTLYNEDGTILYEGEFMAGLYEGQGTLYQDGAVLYTGTFASGEMSGSGKLYAGDLVIYEGEFAGGTFEGAGKEYDPVEGRLLYDGSFVAGKYEGEGRQFDADTGALVYEGTFYQGQREGEGKEYDPETQLPRYEGGFKAGRYDGEGTLYDETLGVPIYKGGFRLGVYHGTGTEYDPVTGFVTAAGEYRNGKLVEVGADGTVTGEVTAPSLPPEETGGESGGEGGTETGGETGSQTGGETGGQTGTETGGQTGTGAVYHGPTTADGGIDYSALAGMSLSEAKDQFSGGGDNWTLADGQATVYSDTTDGIGVTIRADSGGNVISVDVWNDAPVAGATVGMTQSELTAALGSPTQTGKATMGESRMISISQSNRYFGRLTNLSPESQVTIYTYETDAGTVQAVFAGSSGQCLLLEVLP